MTEADKRKAAKQFADSCVITERPWRRGLYGTQHIIKGSQSFLQKLWDLFVDIYWYLLILFLPALGADKAKDCSENADHYPRNDGKAPAETLWDKGDAVGGERASDIRAGIDNARCRWNVSVFFEICGDHTNKKVVNTVHTSRQQSWKKNGEGNKSSREDIDTRAGNCADAENKAGAPNGICKMLWV